MKWQPIETAPKDGTPHVRGLWVYSSKTKKPTHWEANCGFIDENVWFVDMAGDDSHGWAADDYTHWLPLPEPPNE